MDEIVDIVDIVDTVDIIEIIEIVHAVVMVGIVDVVDIDITIVLGVPTFGEGGGVDLVGTKSQIFPKIRFEGSPYKQCR